MLLLSQKGCSRTNQFQRLQHFLFFFIREIHLGIRKADWEQLAAKKYGTIAIPAKYWLFARVQAERPAQAWSFVLPNQTPEKYFLDSVKQGLGPEQDYFDRETKGREHCKKLSIPENIRTKDLKTRNCPKSMHAVSDFWHMLDDLQPCLGAVKSRTAFSNVRPVCSTVTQEERRHQLSVLTAVWWCRKNEV